MDKARLVKIGLITLLAGACIGAGLGVYWVVMGRTASQYMRAGESAYALGLQAFQNKDGASAATHFQEALLQAEKTLTEITNRRAEDASRSPEDLEEERQIEGYALWLKARAIRGQAIASLLVQEKPLPSLGDGTDEQGTFNLDALPMTRIPNDAGRNDAVISLRQAAIRLPTNLEVQKAAMSQEMQMEPPNWQLAPRFAANVLDLDPADDRARFMLARYEFEQPVLQPGSTRNVATVTPLAKRSRDRVLKAQEHLAKVKELETPRGIRWRTLFLEALMQNWQLAHARQAAGGRPSAPEIQADTALRTLLFDKDAGIRHRAEQEQKLGTLSRLDREGLLGLHLMALDVTIEDLKRNRGTAEEVMKALDATLSICQSMASADDANPLRLAEPIKVAMSAMLTAQPYVSSKEPTQAWKANIETMQGLLQRAADKNAGDPAVYVGMVDLLLKEAELAGKQRQTSQQTLLREQCAKWIDVGLRVGETRKLSPPQMLDLHDRAARIKVITSGKRDEILPHTQALKKSPSATSQAVAHLLEGMLAEQEGRLEKAKQSLERTLALNSDDLASRAHMVLANVYLALGRPDRALASLREVDRVYQRLDKLSDEEREWAQHFIRNKDELTLMQVQANLQTAQAQYVALVKEADDMLAASRGAGSTRPTVSSRLKATPNTAAAANAAAKREAQLVTIRESLKGLESEAQTLMKKFKNNSGHDRAARQLFVNYLAITGRITEAQDRLAALAKDYPDNVQVLRQQVQLASLQGPEARESIDKQIQQFISEFPQQTSARILFAEWLTGTGRAEKAVAYLDDPANFPGAKADPRFNLALVKAAVKAGERDRALAALQFLPRDAGSDLMRIRLTATSTEDLQKQVREELTRYEGNGLLACFNAQLSYAKGDYADAAESYLKSMEFTKFRGVARQGLLSSILAMAQDNPRKARDQATAMLQDYPGEPELLLAFAYCSLLLDELGNPKERADRPKDMSSALEFMEQAFISQRQDRVSGPLIKAQLWQLAQRPDLARPEVSRALKLDLDNEKALVLAARLALESSDPVELATGAKYAELLREIQPAAVEPVLLQAQFHERDGATDKAIQAYELLADKHPLSPAGYAGLVAIFESKGDLARAGQWAQLWSSRLPSDASAMAARVRQTALAGQHAEARRLADSFIAEQLKQVAEKSLTPPTRTVDPVQLENQQRLAAGSARASLELAMAIGLKEGRAYAEAESMLRGILQRQPEHEQAQLVLGEIFIGRLRDDPNNPLRAQWIGQAKKAYETVYINRKGHLAAGNNLAWLLAIEGQRPADALQITREVSTGRFSNQPLPPERLPADLLDTMGVVYRKLGKPEHATEMRDLFEAARKRYPHDPRMYLYLGHAYANLNDAKKADQMFAAAVALAGPRSKCNLPASEKQAVVQEAQAELKKLSTPRP